MSPLPTSGAPKDLEELKELLKDDTKIKVAGKLSGLQLDYRLHHYLVAKMKG